LIKKVFIDVASVLSSTCRFCKSWQNMFNQRVHLIPKMDCIKWMQLDKKSY